MLEPIEEIMDEASSEGECKRANPWRIWRTELSSRSAKESSVVTVMVDGKAAPKPEVVSRLGDESIWVIEEP